MGLLSMQHQPQHQQQGHTPSQQQLHSSRPSSVVHQQHQAHGQPPQQPPTAYSASGHSLATGYQHGTQTSSSNQDNLPYYSHQSPYSTPGAASGYTSADTSEMMAAAQIPRPHHYPPMSYHTPQSNSPASVPSPSQHDQHRSIYGPPPSQHMPQSMYYQSQPPHYQSMPPQHNASPYGQPQPTQSPYGQHPQHPQSMTSQPNMMMSHPAPQNHMAQHAAQHAQAGMTGSPRPKIEPQVPLQLQKPQGSPMAPQQQHPQNGAPQLHSPGSQGPGGVNNPNAAPGPIPATTPLVVRQDGNGVQWIAFEYSRDRVKMEYTIRCDVESVNTDDLPQEFKQENCVYPRACCAKDQYRGNRLIYETDCNRVGWALAQLNPSLRGKRGLIQRAVDSWRNSNQDPRLRSRRVRRMAKVNGRGKSSTPGQSAAHLPTPTAAPGMPSAPGAMPQNHAQPMGKPGMGHMAQPMHHHAGGHQDANGPGGDEVGDHDYHNQNHQEVQGGNDVRHNQVFTGYGAQGYPASAHGPPMSHMASHTTTTSRHEKEEEHAGLFPDMPEAKKRKFILVEDNARGSRLRVRVTLQGVDTNEIPDSFRKSSSVYPGSFFRREMQSPPPSATGTRFFPDDLADDGIQETEGRAAGRGGVKRKAAEMVKASVGDDQDGEVAIERMTKSQRQKEVKLNDLGYRMAWLQSRVFSGRTVFLQRALDCYRNKTRVAIESNMQDVKSVAPHFETRAGKRRWNEFSKRGERRDDE